MRKLFNHFKTQFKKNEAFNRAVHSFWQGIITTLVITLPVAIETAQQGGWLVLPHVMIDLLGGLLMAGLSAVKSSINISNGKV
jgi:hypothetical protein